MPTTTSPESELPVIPDSPTAPGLQRRIMSYVALGTVFIVLFFSYIAHKALGNSTQIIYQERLHQASLAARVVEGGLAETSDGRLYMKEPNQVVQMLRMLATPPHGSDPNLHVQLVDKAGRIIVTNGEVPLEMENEHRKLLASNLGNREPGVVVHEPHGPPSAHLVAYAPLPHMGGGILLEQGQDDALAVPRSMFRELGSLAVLFLLVGLFLAWLTTRQVVTPLAKLTDITRHIAFGDLATPVPQAGQDEVRELANSFEAMRRRLEESNAARDQVDRELERRVQERTAELELRNGELAQASERLEELAAERSFLLKQIIRSQEDERRRVARELHDGIGQLLSTMVVRLSALEVRAGADQAAFAEELSEVRSIASGSVTEVRRLLEALRPELLDDMGLAVAIAWYAESVLGKCGVHVDLDLPPSLRLSPQGELVIFRIFQEAINNIVKHAEAQKVRISLHWENDALVGAVDDDGRGFHSSQIGAAATHGAGAGLIGMRERLALVGGTLQIQSNHGRGTHLAFRIPNGKENLT